MTAPAKPAPEITLEMTPFFEAARRHELVVQRCTACGALRFPARAACNRCMSRDVEWVPVAGRGTIFSVAVMHQANHPAFAAVLPYAVVVVELECGVRMISNVVDWPVAEVRIGAPVEVCFEERSPEVTLPVFRRASA
jgi:uncharacterized OB-fold protein